MGTVVFTLGKLAFAAIGVAVGCRLAGQARRTQGLGLHTLALAAIGVGGLGLLAMPVANAAGSAALSLAGEGAVRVALLLLCFFIAGTFRPDAAGIAAAGVCSALAIATLVWDVAVQPSLVHYDYALASSHANQASVALPFGWSAVESALLWRRERRRLRIGLGDGEVAEGYLLWSLTTGCFVGIALLAMGAGVALGAGAGAVADLLQGARGILYLVVTALVWRALFARRRAVPDALEADA